YLFALRRRTRVLHSFPTRRSSDLVLEGLAQPVGGGPHGGGGQGAAREDAQNFGGEIGVGARRGGADFFVAQGRPALGHVQAAVGDRKSTRLNSSHVKISYAVFCLK